MKIKYRVKTHQDFQKVIHENKTLSNRCFVCYYKVNDIDHARIGISASKKLGNAVVRNKIRRQIRMMAKDVINFDKNIDYCIIVKKAYLSNDYATNLNELSILINKINRRIENEI
jgi:ribonuclease P protein component